MKRILPWKDANDSFYSDHICKVAETAIGSYAVMDKGENIKDFAWMLEEGGFEYSRIYKFVDTLDAAIDACEADYLERCTEFLPLAVLMPKEPTND